MGPLFANVAKGVFFLGEIESTVIFVEEILNKKC
jgi:hypothetical protein